MGVKVIIAPKIKLQGWKFAQNMMLSLAWRWCLNSKAWKISMNEKAGAGQQIHH